MALNILWKQLKTFKGEEMESFSMPKSVSFCKMFSIKAESLHFGHVFIFFFRFSNSWWWFPNTSGHNCSWLEFDLSPQGFSIYKQLIIFNCHKIHLCVPIAKTFTLEGQVNSVWICRQTGWIECASTHLFFLPAKRQHLWAAFMKWHSQFTQ